MTRACDNSRTRASKCLGETDGLFLDAYLELRRQAQRYVARERCNHTLQPTALVHETYLRLSQRRGQWQSRAQFVAAAAGTMRHILVDWARYHASQKRGGRSLSQVTLDDSFPQRLPDAFEVLALEQALAALEQHDQRKAKLVELKAFAGLTQRECADCLGVSTASITREWRATKAWLAEFLAVEPTVSSMDEIGLER